MSLAPNQWRDDVVAEARSWIGTPYHHRGAIKNVGTDCGMILIKIFSNVGVIDEFDPGEYPHDWMMHRNEERYLQTVERYAHKIERKPLPGDIALFKYGRCISHGGIVTQWPYMVHAYKSAGIVVEDNINVCLPLKDRLVGFWTVRD